LKQLKRFCYFLVKITYSVEVVVFEGRGQHFSLPIITHSRTVSSKKYNKTYGILKCIKL